MNQPALGSSDRKTFLLCGRGTSETKQRAREMSDPIIGNCNQNKEVGNVRGEVETQIGNVRVR